MTELTTTDIKALRRADDLCVHLDERGGRVRVVKRRKYDEPLTDDIYYAIEAAEVGLENMRGRAELEAGRVKCFAMVRLYPAQKHTASLILRTLRAGDEIIFGFYPDAHTNGYIAAAGLHGDTLNMTVRRKGKTVAHWELTSSICPTNTARMVQGVPDSESYARDAVEARKVA